MDERIRKWRLILGRKADPGGQLNLGGDLEGMDQVLEALYDSERKSGLGKSTPNVNRWLGDIRKYFPTPIVRLMQKDAMDRLKLDQMLLEPELLESVEPDVNLVATLLSLNKVLPSKTRESARQVVRKVVKDLEKRLYNPMVETIQGTLSRSVRNRRPRFNEINWHLTIRANLKNYQKELDTIIPEQLIGHGRKGHQLRHIVLLVDQSGSMATSVVYSGILGCILASLRSIQTHLIAFDTQVADLTKELKDPVDLLFATQLGRGTDIDKALTYALPLITHPADTIVVLISDLFEGGNVKEMLRKIAQIKASGAQFIALLALNDEGVPAYDKDIASQLANMDIPAFGCSPDQFPSLMASAIKKEDLRQWMSREGVVAKN